MVTTLSPKFKVAQEPRNSPKSRPESELQEMSVNIGPDNQPDGGEVQPADEEQNQSTEKMIRATPDRDGEEHLNLSRKFDLGQSMKIGKEEDAFEMAVSWRRPFFSIHQKI